MLNLEAENLRASVDFIGGKLNIIMDVCDDSKAAVKAMIAELQGKKLSVSIKPYRKQRSLDANAYMWVLCESIAQKIGSTKEEVYRLHVKEVGAYQRLVMLEDAVPEFQRIWSANGIAWFAEIVDAVDDQCVMVYAYQGSSTYDTAQMARLLDEIIREAEGLGIPTMTDEQLNKMKSGWKGGSK